MNTFIRLVAFLLLMVVGAGATLAQAPLRWKLEKGQKFQLQMQQQTASHVAISNKKLDSTVDLIVFVGWEVLQAESDSFVVEQTIDAVRIEMKGPGENAVTYDTREKKAVVGAAKELATSLAPLIGAKFKVTMSSQGVITAAEKIAVEAEAPPAPAVAGAKPPLGKEAIEQLLREPFLPLPKELAGAEATWTDEKQTTSALGEVKLTRTFTLAGNEDRAGMPASKIEVKGELTVTPPANSKGVAKLKLQSHAGTIWFAKEPGRLLAAETKQQLVTESSYRDSIITVDLTTTLTTTLTPK
jgi:hypothetical protein